jgi:hypothetical protein
MARPVKTYDPRDVRHGNVSRFRGVTSGLKGTQVPDELVNAQENLQSNEIRRLAVRNGQVRTDTAYEGTVHSRFIGEETDALAEGSRVWSAELYPSASGPVSGLPTNPDFPEFDPIIVPGPGAWDIPDPPPFDWPDTPDGPPPTWIPPDEDMPDGPNCPSPFGCDEEGECDFDVQIVKSVTDLGVPLSVTYRVMKYTVIGQGAVCVDCNAEDGCSGFCCGPCLETALQKALNAAQAEAVAEFAEGVVVTQTADGPWATWADIWNDVVCDPATFTDTATDEGSFGSTPIGFPCAYAINHSSCSNYDPSYDPLVVGNIANWEVSQVSYWLVAEKITFAYGGSNPLGSLIYCTQPYVQVGGQELNIQDFSPTYDTNTVTIYDVPISPIGSITPAQCGALTEPTWGVDGEGSLICYIPRYSWNCQGRPPKIWRLP